MGDAFKQISSEMSILPANLRGILGWRGIHRSFERFVCSLFDKKNRIGSNFVRNEIIRGYTLIPFTEKIKQRGPSSNKSTRSQGSK